MITAVGMMQFLKGIGFKDGLLPSQRPPEPPKIKDPYKPENMIAKYKHLEGQTIGRLKLLEVTGSVSLKWHWQCECGKEKWIEARAVLNERIRSCGCFDKERRKLTAAERAHRARQEKLSAMFKSG